MSNLWEAVYRYFMGEFAVNKIVKGVNKGGGKCKYCLLGLYLLLVGILFVRICGTVGGEIIIYDNNTQFILEKHVEPNML